MSSAIFTPGEIVAARFKIIRLIGEGGGGQVYEAEDLDLAGRVALKTVLSEIAEDDDTIRRFRREIQLARKVTHPNVCRTFDIFHHRKEDPETGKERDVALLSMELLCGETLSELIRRSKKLAPAQALPIASQIVQALQAAHKEGIIHRDLKSANVILLPGKEGEAPRAVVTDFGLAHNITTTESPTVSHLTGSGAILGTPAYMAPEQAEGKEATTASDIYALGVVLYEMVTGKQPYAGESLVSALVKKVKEEPPSPRSLVPDLARDWEKVILRCLERDPGNRFASAGEALRALQGESVAPSRRRRMQIGLIALSTIVLVVTGLFLIYRMGVLHPPSPAQTAPSRRSVAVLGFKNLSVRPETAWLSTALSEMLTTELAAGQELRTISGENVARMKVDLALPDTDSLAVDTLSKVRANLGSDFVVLGSYLDLGKDSGGQIRVDLKLQDTAKGETIAAISANGSEAQLADLVSRAGHAVREKLGVKALLSSETESVRASAPSNTEAIRLYSEGLNKLRLFDPLSARDLLQKAVAADPEYPLAHSALAQAWSDLGYDGNAREEAKRAFELAAKLDREERLLVEARFRQANGETEKAIGVYRTLFTFAPDNLDYGLQLADVQDKAGKSQEALATLEVLRKMPPPARDDPRIDLAETNSALIVSDFSRARITAAKTAKKGATLNARRVVGMAHFYEAFAFWRLGENSKAMAACDTAGKVFKEINDVLYEARNLNLQANVLTEQGEHSRAITFYEEAIEKLQSIKNQKRLSMVFNNVGLSLWYEGQLTEARKAYEESKALAEEVGDKNLTVYYLYNVGLLTMDQGDLRTAKKMFDEGFRLSEGQGDKYVNARQLHGLGLLETSQGNLKEARQSHENALKIRDATGQKGEAAISRVALASLSLEEMRPQDAEPLTRQAAQEFHQEGRMTEEGYAYVVLARALFAQGKVSDAQASIGKAENLLRKTEDFSKGIWLAIMQARLRAASGNSADAAQAQKILGDAIAQTRERGFLGLQYEARLALGEIEIKSGAKMTGRKRVQALQEEARAKGFALIERKARVLIGQI